MKKLFSIGLFIIISIYSLTANCEIKTNVGISTKQVDATNTYRIDFDGYLFWVNVTYGSELKFDSKINLCGAFWEIVDDERNYSMGVSYFTSYNDRDGNLADSDYFYLNGAKSVFCYSDTELSTDMSEFNLYGDYTFYKKDNISFKALAEYSYQKFEYTGRNTLQEDYLFGTVTFVSADTIKYEIEHNMYKVGIEGEFIGRFYGKAKLFYIPYVKSEDRDDHLMMNKRMEGEGDGDGYEAVITVGYKYNNWDFALRFSHIEFDVDGSQTQTLFSTGSTAKVNWESETDEDIIELKISYKF